MDIPCIKCAFKIACDPWYFIILLLIDLLFIARCYYYGACRPLATAVNIIMGPLLLTWTNYNSSVDK